MEYSTSRRRFLTVAGGAVGAGALASGTGYAVLGGRQVPVSAVASGFGYTDDGTNYVISTGADLVFKVSHLNGDLTSLVYKGTEYQGYNGQNSQVESGLGASTVTISEPASGAGPTAPPAPSTTRASGSSTTTTSAGQPAGSACGWCAATTRRPPAGPST